MTTTAGWIEDGHTAVLTLTEGRIATRVHCPHPQTLPPDTPVPACRTLLADASAEFSPPAPCLLAATAHVYQDDELWDADQPDHPIGACPFPVRWRAEAGPNGAELYLAPIPQSGTEADAGRGAPSA